MSNSILLPVLAMSFTTVMWGLSFLSIKVSVEYIPPMTLALLRFILASFILTILFRVIEPGSKLIKKDVPALSLSGLFGICLYFFCVNTGVKYTTASAASIIMAAVPVFSILADYLFFKVPLSWQKVFCVLLSLSGICLVVGAGFTGHGSRGSLQGNLLMMGGALSWVAYNILTRPLGDQRSLMYIVTYQAIFGMIFLFPLSLLEVGGWQPIPAHIILNVVFLGVFSTALGFILYVYALNVLGIGVSSLFANLSPVATVIGSYFLLNETVSPVQMAGGLLIIISVLMVSRKQPSGRPAPDLQGKDPREKSPSG